MKAGTEPVASTLRSIEFSELLRYNAGEARKWYEWLSKQPASVLDLPVEIYGKTARDLVHHIFAVELRYAQRLTGQPVSAYEDLPKDTLEGMYDIQRRAQEMLTKFLESASDDELNSTLTFKTISAGELSATKRKIFAHALLHGVRHWAQLATAMRKHGFQTDWGHDLLLSDAVQ